MVPAQQTTAVTGTADPTRVTSANRTAGFLRGLRAVVALLLFIHGSTRLIGHSVADFGEFFVAHHLPAFGAGVITREAP